MPAYQKVSRAPMDLMRMGYSTCSM
jgi:hypothetical protein